MKITLLDINPLMTDAWNQYFKDSNINIVNMLFSEFMDKNEDVDTIVSPANSFGLMDGGYDRAIINYLGRQIMLDVQKEILKQWHGEQPVGTGLVVFENNSTEGRMLIHIPTMQLPEKIIDYNVIYNCMRTALLLTKKYNRKHVVIPAFGGATGGVPYNIVAEKMYAAYKQVNIELPDKITWDYAKSVYCNTNFKIIL